MNCGAAASSMIWIRADQPAAIQRASCQNSFKVKHLNLWVNGRDPWYEHGGLEGMR